MPRILHNSNVVCFFLLIAAAEHEKLQRLQQVSVLWRVSEHPWLWGDIFCHFSFHSTVHMAIVFFSVQNVTWNDLFDSEV